MEENQNDKQKDFIDFRCSNCDVLLRVKKESAGRKGQCPKCGYIVKVTPKKKRITEFFNKFLYPIDN